jgi:hypothetical protein
MYCPNSQEDKIGNRECSAVHLLSLHIELWAGQSGKPSQADAPMATCCLLLVQMAGCNSPQYLECYRRAVIDYG